MIINVPGVNTTPSAAQIPVSDEVQKMTGAENVDDALKKNGAMASYIALCSNVNLDSVNSALGMNNEENAYGVCTALAYYSYFKGTSESEKPFYNLRRCTNLRSLLDNTSGLLEASSDSIISNFILNNAYANSILGEAITTSRLCQIIGKNLEDYKTVKSICNDREFMDAICENQSAFNVVANSKIFLSEILSNNTAKASMYENASLMMSQELSASVVAQELFAEIKTSASVSSKNTLSNIGEGKILVIRIGCSGESAQYGNFSGFVGSNVPSSDSVYGGNSKYVFYFSSSFSMYASKYGTAVADYIKWDYE